MTTEPSRKCAGNTRGRPFRPGNPGKPRGTRHKATMAAETLLEGEAESLTRKAVALALEGDTVALRLCLERILPPRRDRPVNFALPEVAGMVDVAKAFASILAALAIGDVTPVEAAAVAGVIETYRRVLETTDIERRLAALEERGS